MQMTYNEARDSIIEHTEIGYTLASQDRLWVVFVFDLWSEDEFRYNRIYSRGIGDGWAYDIDIDALVWTNRWEAEEFARRLRRYLSKHRADADTANPDTGENEMPQVYVMNLGDEARLEATYIGLDSGRQSRTTPKYKGSQEAWDASKAMRERWVERFFA